MWTTVHTSINDVDGTLFFPSIAMVFGLIVARKRSFQGSETIGRKFVPNVFVFDKTDIPPVIPLVLKSCMCGVKWFVDALVSWTKFCRWFRVIIEICRFWILWNGILWKFFSRRPECGRRTGLQWYCRPISWGVRRSWSELNSWKSRRTKAWLTR